MRDLSLWVLLPLLLVACASIEKTESGLLKDNFKTEIKGKKTDLYVLKNNNNMEVCITNFGGRIVSVIVPDKNGRMQDVVLGFDNINDYINISSDFGASIGRYANRINKGQFSIDGIKYQLPTNNYGHCLHGGPEGFQYQVYDAHQINPQTLELSYTSKDGEEGFPGKITCKVSMTLTDENAIDIRYEATSDKPTIVNMTNHSYFNLDGDAKSNAQHLLSINADSFTPVDSTFMTTGEIVPVKGTPLDFTVPIAIGSRIDGDCLQLKNGHGYDHNWVLNTKGNINEKCATLTSLKSGIVLEVYTNEPGLQFYAGNFLDGTVKGKHGIIYNKRASVCLETQKFPDSPNKLQWLSPILRPGQIYHSECVYKFSIAK